MTDLGSLKCTNFYEMIGSVIAVAERFGVLIAEEPIGMTF
jgi:hypothetical protein